MRHVVDNLDIEVRSAILPHGYYGLYDDVRKLILIHRNMTYTMKRCTLAHELIHWVYGDNTCRGTMGARMEHRTRRETATLLLDPVEYASAENIYEGDAALIALELDVTEQVVKDYQALVLDRRQYV
ncbi:ImmA/IrrE family metallo-endopeptidase [Bifidobacterium mongoliense]|nr:ImmA/IrrE family metallo-endopeptidase [Bifidobacterium mongoliense]